MHLYRAAWTLWAQPYAGSLAAAVRTVLAYPRLHTSADSEPHTHTHARTQRARDRVGRKEHRPRAQKMSIVVPGLSSSPTSPKPSMPIAAHTHRRRVCEKATE